MQDRYKNNVYFGIVEDNNDPRKQGRLKVRVQNVFDGIPLAHIPWSSPYIVPNGKSFSIPSVGKIVNVTFDNGSIYAPYYIYTEKFNINLQDKLESLGDDDYDNFNALFFDHRTQIYSETDKLTLDFKLNKMTIDNESMNLELKDNAQLLNLGSRNADQPVILGKNFMDWFFEFVKALINPANMNAAGSPVVKPNIDILLNEFMMKRGTFVSTNVFVPDNSSIDTLQRDTITSEVEHDDLGIVAPNENFGVANEDGTIEGAAGTQSSGESNGSGSNSNNEINTSTNVEELSQQKQNVEESSTVSEESKEKIQKKQEKEKEGIEESKPKLIIRIPIPYTDKYITIKLGLLLGILAGALLALLVLKLLSKILGNMSSGFPIAPSPMNTSEEEIKEEINKMDMNALKNELKNKVDVDDVIPGNEGLGDNILDTNVDSTNQEDKYIKNKKSNKSKRNPFSYLNRGREDLLDSDNVKNRNGNNDDGYKNNNNYGSYY